MKTIGIDPDLHKSGLAVFENNKLIYCESLYLWDVFYFILRNPALVLLEKSDNKGTWHKGGFGAAQNVGKNKAIAIIIEEFLKKHKIGYKIVQPAGYSKFFDNPKFFQKQTGWEKRTNKDARAAAAICYLNQYI